MKFTMILISSLIVGMIGWELLFLTLGVVFVLFMTSEMFISFNYIMNYFEVGLIVLSILISMLMLMVSMFYFYKNNNFMYFFYGVFSLMFVLVMCFMTTNFFVFYMLFEFSVIPTFIMILGWGYSVERLQAGMYMFIYTFITSLPFLLFLIKFSKEWGYLNFNMSLFLLNNHLLSSFWWVMISMVFLVKFPIFLVHIWLPKAHVEAPMAGSMILAGVLLKLGGYGFWKSFQYSISFLSDYKMFLYSLAILGSMFISLICIRQMDMKCLIAYSSVAHMGPVLGAMLTFTWIGWLGAFFMMIAHGICSSGLFFALNCSYEQFKSRSMLLLKGISILNPVMMFWWFFLCCSNMSCPPTANFVSELMIIISVMFWGNSYVFMMVAVLLMMSGVYSICLFINMNHGDHMYKHIFMFTNIRDLMSFFIHSFPLLIMIIFIQFLY